MRPLRLDPLLWRLALAIAIAAAATALQWMARPWVGARIPFLFFLPAVVLAASLAGRPAGTLVLATGAISALFWLRAPGGGFVTSSGDQVSVLLYLMFGALMVELGERLRRMQARATTAEARLMVAIEGTGVGVFDVDLVAETGYVSPALARLVGLPAAPRPQPLGAWLQVLPPALVDQARQYLAEGPDDPGSAFEHEVSLPRPDGSPVGLLLRVRVEWAGRRALRLQGTCVDITERKEVNAQLLRTRGQLRQQVADLDRLHELSSQLPDAPGLAQQLSMILATLVRFHEARLGIVVLGDTQAGCHVVEAAVGYGRDVWPQLVEIDAGACHAAAAQRARVVITDTENDDRFTSARGWAREHGFRAVHSTPLVSPQGDFIGTLAVHLDEPRAATERERTLADICARKAVVFIERARARAALEESQGRFEAVLEASGAPFTVLEPVKDGTRIVDFRCTYVNRAAAHVMGRPASALLGQQVLALMPGRWRGSPEFHACVQVLEQGRTYEFDTSAVGGAARRWFHCIASPIRGTVAVWFTDITERIHNEQLLRDGDRRKDEFLATLAHELRNPLAPIRQAALLSMSAGSDEAQKRWSHEVIERQVRHMALLLDDLLDVSRITRGVLTLRKVQTDLAAVVAAAVETARPAIDAKHHTLQLELPAEPVPFAADPLRVSQVLANLLTNAAKYTGEGGRIELHAARRGDEVVIEVADNGIGIPPALRPEMFRMFAQLRGPRDAAGGGLGIGLALSKGLVELHGGQLEVHSEGSGCGSVFTVRLPLGHGAPPATPVVPARPASAPVVRRVLVADDNRDAAETLAVLLRLEGHELHLAFDGEHALALWQQQQPDACLLDIGMPGHNGYAIARAIRRAPGGDRPLLVAITGWGQQQDRQRALEAGFDLHLTKPVDPARLARLLAGDPLRQPPP